MDDFSDKTKKVIYFFIGIFIISLLIMIIWLLILKYNVEGENNMPFELSQMVVVSTAEGINTEGDRTWNFDLMQNNDIYIHLSKNKNYNDKEIIKRISIKNFNIKNAPQKGEITIYKPSKNDKKTYEYLDEYIVEDSLVYDGNEKENLKELQIANQGGVIAFRYTNKNLRKVFFG